MSAHWDKDTLILHCHLQPQARNNEWAGRHDGAFKVRIKAAPIDGKANKALIAFLAKEFGVPKKQVELLSGHTNKRKRLRITSPHCIPNSLSDTMPRKDS